MGLCKQHGAAVPLNESPSEKEGKCVRLHPAPKSSSRALNESPSEKEGKYAANRGFRQIQQPSMKVPPKRKGNDAGSRGSGNPRVALNESPSEKEGK